MTGRRTPGAEKEALALPALSEADRSGLRHEAVEVSRRLPLSTPK